ncbi:head GIN domain-containing protein [Adhaeribacter soli]|uniref:DUF2807 domain-containing protein n=1 Tax=Adhaeribacter soli TaxID=2607655 RepID=A0A5N1J3I9_9BACT|nr:head GIN domain-containing protein [Adhaeribacter soli]KAA9340665.1 DUF2807 domain-containing protein [Adhaeribacter soli]
MKYSFFRNYLAFCLLLTAFAFTSCNKETLRGKGDIISKTRTVGTYEAISVGGEFEIYLTQGPAQDIKLEGQENVLAEVITTTRNNELKIEFNKDNVKIDEPVRVYLSTPNLKEINLSGANRVIGATDWQVNDFKVSTSGSSTVNLTLKGAADVQTRISGSGEITYYGDASTHDLEISGSGKLKAFGFTTKISDIGISGSGRAEVMAIEKLSAQVSGSGKVYYKGNPAENSSVSGSGSISKVD